MGNLNSSAKINRVDHRDRQLGVTNRKDLPHSPANFRVVHVFVFTSSGELVLQHIAPGQRSAGLWGSSVAGYVLAGEDYASASLRKLADELGSDVAAPPRFVGKTTMRDLGATKFIALFEHVSDGPFSVNSEQVSGLRMVEPNQLGLEIDAHPERFTATFEILWRFYQQSKGVHHSDD